MRQPSAPVSALARWGLCKMLATLKSERITATLMAPVLLAMVAALAFVLWLVDRAADRLDAEAAAYGQRLARTFIEQNLGRLEEMTYDNAWWDPAVANLVTMPDAYWANENVGWYWHETFGLKASFVVDPQGETVFAFVDGVESETPAKAMLGSALPALMRAARAEASEAPGSASAVVETPGGLAFVGLSLLTPEHVQAGSPAPGQRSALIAVRSLDAALLAQAAVQFQLDRLGFRPPAATPHHGGGAFDLRGAGGELVARLTWRPAHPGDQLRDSLILPMAGVGAVVLGLFGLFVWVSHRVATRLNAARLAAEGASEAKSRFLANMSHELRTPLNAILGFSELIMLGHTAGSDNDRQCEYGEAIHLSGQHLLDLIEDILDLSKIESGRQELRLEPLDVGTAFEEVSKGLASVLAARGHTVSLEVPEGLPPLVADPRAVRQILYNLLSNAAKFTPDNGTLVIGACLASGEGIELFVRDNGIGMAPEDLRRVRLPFEQVADPRGIATGGGTGLGLSIVEGLASLHGGRLQLDSVPGHGTRAAVVLPLEPQHTAS